MIAAAESLYAIFPSWLVLAAVILETATLVQVWYWLRHGRFRLRLVAALPLAASTGAMALLYVVVTFTPDSVSLTLRGAVFRILTFLMSAGFVHLFADYWFMSWEAWRERRS